MTTKDMLQALIKGQAALEAKIALGFKEVNERLDKQGKQLARLQLPSANSRWRAGIS